MKARRILTPVFFALTLFLMTLIFYFSSQDASLSIKTSSTVVRIVLSVFIRNFKTLPFAEQGILISRYSGLIRKAAHFSEFAALGFSFTTLLFLVGKSRHYIFSMLFGFLYALSDELHQLFSDGRACSFLDVLIDSAGFSSGLIVSLLITCIITRRKC